MNFLKKTLSTRKDYSLLVMRVVLGFVFLPHALQKTLGWFGGGGFEGTLGFFGSIGIPAFLGVLAILTESVGSVALLTGFMSRFAAVGIAGVMLGAITRVHWSNGFFMNWMGNQGGEGFEYHLLVIAMCVALMIGGSGAFSVDRKLSSADQAARLK